MDSPMPEVLRLIEAETRRSHQRPKELRVPKALRDAVCAYIDRSDRRLGIVPPRPADYLGEVTVFGVRLVEDDRT